MFDVLLTNVPPEILPSYPVILLAGDIEFNTIFLGELEKALRRGSRVLMSPRHRAALGAAFDRVAQHGDVDVLDPWVNPATGRPAAVSNDRLTRLCRDVLPITVEGDAVQYQVNRLPSGWVIELVNNRGVSKKPDRPAETDSTAVARVTLRPRIACVSAKEWRSGRTYQSTDSIALDIGSGATAFLEFVSKP
jgi:hypothetical protein